MGYKHRANAPRLKGNRLLVMHYDSFGEDGTSIHFSCPGKCKQRIGVYVNGNNDYTASIPLYGSTVSIRQSLYCHSCDLRFYLTNNEARAC